MPVYALGAVEPSIDPSAWVHPEAVVIGDVVIGPQASVWPCAVLRGDLCRIEVGARTSIQDGCVIHITSEDPTTIGADCVVGHTAYLEGCVVEDGVLVGAHACVLPGARIGAGSIVAAGAVVRLGTEVPARSLVRGVPAEVVPGAIEPGRNAGGAQRYVDNAARYRRELRRLA